MLLWGSLAIIYFVLFVWLGLATFRRGHLMLGIFGFIFPLLWIFGAFTPGPSDVAEGS